MRRGVWTACWLAVATAAHAAPFPPDPDSDGDGLSDFAETHKHRTDPKKADTDGDGVPDGDWVERREHTYSIRFVVRALPPATAIQDDWQDARVVDRCADYVEIEIVAYPLADPDADIPRTRERETAAAAAPEHVSPNLTCDFDDAMRAQLTADLKKDGIDAAALSDRDLVERVTKWAMDTSQFEESGFCAQIVMEVGGRLAPVPGLEAEFRRRKEGSDPKRTDREQLERELLGRAMYGRRRHGACTSSAVYLATILRALGVPTRQTLAMPAADASDDAQVALLARGIRNPAVRGPVLAAMRSMRGSNASHNFDVVRVGGRWRRLNYARLGPPLVDAHMMGILLRVFEFDELATSGIAPTWGRFGAVGPRTHEFRGPNPYRLVDVTDRIGPHAKERVALDDGEVLGAPAEHAALTIVAAEWKRDDRDGAKLMVSRGENVLLCRVREWFDDQDAAQYTRFTERTDREFELATDDGKHRVPATCRVGFETGPGLHAVWIGVPADAVAKLPRGAKLRLVSKNAVPAAQWRVEMKDPIARP